MAAKHFDMNYSLTILYMQALGNIYVKFPLDQSSRSGEEDFLYVLG